MNYEEQQEFNKLETDLETVRQQGIETLNAYGVELQSNDSLQDIVDGIQKIELVKDVTVNDNTITVTKNDGTIEQYTIKTTTYSAANNNLGLIKTGGHLTIVNGIAYVNNNSHKHSVENVDGLQEALDTIPTVSDWAQAETKPTYTAEEVGADPKGSADTALSSAKSYADSKDNTTLTTAKEYTDTAIADLINGAPTTLDTLGEIATAMSDNQNVVEALNTAIGTKANKSDLTGHTGNKSNPHSVTKAQVGLGNVPNVATNDQTPTYSDTTTFATLTSGEKVSVAFGKIKLAITNLINHIANKSNPHAVTKAQVGLGNVENKSSATIRGELTSDNVIKALGYEPTISDTTYGVATSTSDGLMSATDKSKLDGVEAGANKYTHPNSGATAGTYRSVTVNAQGHVTGGSNPTVTIGQGGTGATTANSASYNLLKDIPEWTTDAVDTTKIVCEYITPSAENGVLGYRTASYFWNYIKSKADSVYAAISHTHTKSQITDFPTIPTKTSQLTNDSGYKTTDSNTTYTLTKSGSTITLTGSDGKTTSVTDSDTTYSVATQSANGLMSATDKKKLDGLGGSKAPFVISSTAPSDTSVFWICDGVLKYYDGSQWVACLATLS